MRIFTISLYICNMIQEEFKFYKPCKLLQPYVRYYWVLSSNQMLKTYTFPIGCSQIIFHKRTPLYVPELDTTQHKLTISGQVNFSSHLQADDDIEMIVVVFYPHTINLFLDTPASSFYNKEVSGYDIEDKHLAELAKQVFECEDNNHCVNLIERWLLSRLSIRPYETTYRVRRMLAAIEQLCAAPQTLITDLSSTCCLGKKQFEREFCLHVGMNPKEYSRIVRFQKTLKQMQHQRSKINQADLAYTNGYADQSHLIREFKKLCGYTPLSLLEVATPYSDLFTIPI